MCYKGTKGSDIYVQNGAVEKVKRHCQNIKQLIGLQDSSAKFIVMGVYLSAF